jgi:hypothetical protein
MAHEKISSPNLQVIEKKRLYVGCGLTLAPQPFKDSVERLKGELSKDWHVLEFLGLTAGTAADVYQRDIVENVGTCDAFIAVADEPSIGLGYELAMAAEMYRKPVLATAHIGSKVTRLLLGAVEVHDNMIYRPYEDMVTDVPKIAREVFTNILDSAALHGER